MSPHNSSRHISELQSSASGGRPTLLDRPCVPAVEHGRGWGA